MVFLSVLKRLMILPSAYFLLPRQSLRSTQSARAIVDAEISPTFPITRESLFAL